MEAAYGFQFFSKNFLFQNERDMPFCLQVALSILYVVAGTLQSKRKYLRILTEIELSFALSKQFFGKIAILQNTSIFFVEYFYFEYDVEVPCYDGLGGHELDHAEG